MKLSFFVAIIYENRVYFKIRYNAYPHLNNKTPTVNLLSYAIMNPGQCDFEEYQSCRSLMKPITDTLFIVGGKAKCIAVPMIFIKIVWSVIEKMWQRKKESKIKEKNNNAKTKRSSVETEDLMIGEKVWSWQVYLNYKVILIIFFLS